MAIRLKGAVLGNGFDPDLTDETFLISVQGSPALSGASGGEAGIFYMALPLAIASMLPVGNVCNIYLALSLGEISAIEGAVSITPASTTD